jgi:hypothetical protein
MKLERRLQQLELTIKLNFKQPGCNITLFIAVPEELQQTCFDSDSYKPAEGELVWYLKYIRENGLCRDCKGSCSVEWTPDGFENHTLSREHSSSSSESKTSFMYCADAEIPVLSRRIMNGERT